MMKIFVTRPLHNCAAKSHVEDGEANMENCSTTVEVDDAVATIIANVQFEEFPSDVVDGSFVVERINSVQEEDQSINDNEVGGFQSCEVKQNHGEDHVAQAGASGMPTRKRQYMQRKKRSEEDGTYPNIKSWKPYINSLIDNGIRGYYKAALPTSQNSCPNVEDYLKPDIILWDLQKECPELNGTICPNENCNELLSLYPIAYTYMMRILYDFEKPVLLVTSMLRCKNAREHRFLGYDPRILKQLADPDNVPFVLFHKVGMTRELFNSIMNQVSNGVKFGQIQDMLRKNYIQSHMERENAYQTALHQFKSDHPEAGQVGEKFPSIKIKGPRNTFISQCFLLGFKEKEYFYKLSMSQLLADDWVKLDSLKLPTNVGTNAKGVWKKEVEHLFYCQNEVGQVLTWQLTGVNGFDEVKETLISIRDRHEQIGKQLKGCCTGFCCNWRDALLSVFGGDFLVKSDVDFAIGKIAERLQEESLMFQPCIDDLRLVFQDPVDTNKVRILPTAPPAVILNNLELFKEKWKKVKENGKLVLNNTVLKAIGEMEPHILNGCYSDIVPFPNCIDRREFQQSMKKKVNNCRLGIPVMVAIASIGLHEHNTSRQEELGRDTAPVLLVVPDEDKTEPSEGDGAVSLGNSNLQCLTVEVNMNKALESIATSQAKAIKFSEQVDCKALLKEVDDYFAINISDPKDHTYQVKDNNLDETIIKKTLTFLCYAEQLSQREPSNTFNEKLIPFLTCAFPLLLQEKGAMLTRDDTNIIADRLKNVEDLEILPFSIQVEITQEGSFLNAIGKILQIYVKIHPDDVDDKLSSFQEFLKSLKFASDMNLVNIIANLKLLLKEKGKCTDTSQGADVCEKQNETKEGKEVKTHHDNDGGEESNEKNIDLEQKEHDPSNLERMSSTDEKTKLKDENKQASDIGDFEVLVRNTASLLSIQISILSTMKHFPVIPVFPQKLSSWSPNVFLFFKGGIFLPLLSKEKLREINEKEEGTEEKQKREIAKIKCRCGRGNPKIKDGRCYTHENSKYTTRCMCFRMQQPCTSKCDCKNCKNPYGDRPAKRPLQVNESDVGLSASVKRRRYTHHHSNLCKDLTAEHFQTGAGLEVSLGKWSLAEKYLFEALISEMKTEEESLTTEIVAQKFNNVVQVATSIKGLKNIIGFKTPTQVNDRLKEREKDVEEYLVLYQSQLDLLLKSEDDLDSGHQEENDRETTEDLDSKQSKLISN